MAEILRQHLAALCSGGCGKSVWHTHEGQFLDDDVLQQRVQLALQRNGKPFHDVRARASNGTVVLTGTVASDDLRAKSEEISRGMHGVKDVDDQIHLRNAGR